jgi:hypothetical protein
VIVSPSFAYQVFLELFEKLIAPVIEGRILSIVYTLLFILSELFNLSIERYLRYFVSSVLAFPVIFAAVPAIFGVHVSVLSIQYRVHENVQIPISDLESVTGILVLLVHEFGVAILTGAVLSKI